MNSKMTRNSDQQLTLKKKQEKQTNQTTRTGTESQKWRSHGRLSVGNRRRVMAGAKVQGISSINGRQQIDMGRLIIV